VSDLSSTQVQILAIAGFLSVTWGVYLLGVIDDYRKIRADFRHTRRRQDLVAGLRRVVVALCIWLFVFSYVFRISSVWFGVSDELSAQIVFFALLGSNVVGSIFAAVTIWRDE
jgi:UDP-N-acetylmuramyl pentapeptide phosphotransferase/UDP-N-acetylglucosamine-1-phosphate transferase